MQLVNEAWRSVRTPKASIRKLYEDTVDRLGLLLRQRDELTPPQRLFADPDRMDGSQNVREFICIGESTSDWLFECGLRSHHRVLEVGCGIGRVAIALTARLNQGGSYVGVEITPTKVEYCRRTVSRYHSNFRFELADIYNKYYNPTGTQQAASYRFPFADATFDFVFLVSVFTHMLQDGLDRYLGEIYRVMKPGTRVVATFYLDEIPAGDPFTTTPTYATSSTQPSPSMAFGTIATS